MNYNIEQANAIELALEGKNIFLTGPGGTGKSYVLRGIMQECNKKKYVSSLTAMTGCAALLLNAKTLHSWAGVGLATESVAKLVSGIRKNNKALRHWLLTRVLIVDEVSMMSPEFFEKLDAIGKAIRNNTNPMGGIQVIFVGDFFQLPPVMKEVKVKPEFIFETYLWKDYGFQVVNLQQNMRQSDIKFHKVLKEAREGRLSIESYEILENRKGIEWKHLEIKPTLLFPQRVIVNNINEQNLNALKGPKHTYKVKTVFSSGSINQETPQLIYAINKMDRDAPYDTELILAVGAQVMLVANISVETGLANGSRGVVTGFKNDLTPLVKFIDTTIPIEVGHYLWKIDDNEGVSRSQIPLKLAYALTIHKSQGATLDSALIDIGSNTFEYGQAYVALSRVKSLESLYIWDLERDAFKAHPKVTEYYHNLPSTV